MTTKELIELVERATCNNVNGYDVIEALRLAIPVLSQTEILEINKIITFHAADRNKKPGDHGEPELFSKKEITITTDGSERR